VLDIIDKMPKVPSPDALGLNDNSAVLKHTADTENLLRGVVLTSPASSSGKDAENGEKTSKTHSSRSKDATSKVPIYPLHISILVISINFILLYYQNCLLIFSFTQ
jgi:hypothetical protein